MFPATITLHNASDLQKVMSVLYPTTDVVEITDKSRDVATQTNDANLQDLADKTEVKADPKPTAVKTGQPAASQPTAEAGKADAQQTKGAATSDDKPLTYTADVKPVLLGKIKAGHRDACVALLAEFKVDHGEKLTADQLPKFLARLNAIGAEG